MAIVDHFEVPNTAQELQLPTDPNATFFILFLASIDPQTKQPWCSDVRASLPLLNKIFSSPASSMVHYAYVGQKADYKGIASNRFKTNWNIQNIPALCRFQSKDGKIMETGRLVEAELLDEARVHTLIGAMDI